MADSRQRVFSITELDRTGQAVTNGGRPLKFEWDWKGRSGPQGVWRMPLKLRTVRHDYGGSEEPVEQVLGWNFEPFTLQGKWDDRWNSSGFALQTWRAFEQMCQRGSLVRVELEQVTVTGLITRFEPGYRHAGLIEWSVEVSPHFRHKGDGVRQATFLPPTAAHPDQRVAEVKQQRDDLLELNDGVTQHNVSEDFVDVGDLLGSVSARVTEADQALATAEGQVDVFGRLAHSFSSVKSASFDMVTRLARMKSDTGAALQTAAAVLDFERWARGLAYEGRRMAVKGEDARRQTQARHTPDTKAVYRPREGEHVYSVSQRFYGDASGWRRIMEVNQLDSPVFRGDETIVIPEVRP